MRVRVSINNRACTVMLFIVHPVTDWCRIGPQNLRELSLTFSCLQIPTAEMCNLVTATGHKCSQKAALLPGSIMGANKPIRN